MQAPKGTGNKFEIMHTTAVSLLAVDDLRQFVLPSTCGYAITELNGNLILRVVICKTCGASESDFSGAINIDLLSIGSWHNENIFFCAIVGERRNRGLNTPILSGIGCQ